MAHEYARTLQACSTVIAPKIASRTRVRIAVAGTGLFGREHLRVLSQMEDVVAAGVADIDRTSATRCAELFGATGVFGDAAEMLHKLRPDGVIVATPGSTHVQIACAALDLDIPVLLEKPVALTAAGADLLIEAENASRAFVLPGHILRFSEPYRTVVDIARSGELGSVLSVSSRNHRDETHATRYPDVDPVLMTMVHEIDMTLLITGAGLASVLALRRPEGTSRSETLITGTGRSGSMWHISNAWTQPTVEGPPDRLEVVCQNGSAELELDALIRVFGTKGREFDLRERPADDMLRTELSYFVDCIRTGGKPAIVTLDDARQGLLAAEAIMESLRTGKLVDL
jgi:predicted dehydrogenase